MNAPIAERSIPANMVGLSFSLNRIAARSSVAPGFKVTTIAALPAATSCRLNIKNSE
ncbi:hypothetical protein D3C71_2235960 [compost metagenome]